MSSRPAQIASVLAIGLLAATALAEPGPTAAPRNGPPTPIVRPSAGNLAWRRQQELEHSRQFAEALENARAMLADPARTSEQTALLRERVAFDLFNLDRVDEAVRSYDRQIADAVDHPTERFALLEAKAQQLLSHAEAGRAIAACRDFRAATRPNSEAWQTATAMLALALRRAGDHRESIALRSELLKSRRKRPSAGRGAASRNRPLRAGLGR